MPIEELRNGVNQDATDAPTALVPGPLPLQMTAAATTAAVDAGVTVEPLAMSGDDEDAGAAAAAEEIGGDAVNSADEAPEGRQWPRQPGAERGKRSVAYHHTLPFKQVVDATGVGFDVRSCRYCHAVFSFKGGTTSAALRHLKAAHPEAVPEMRAAGDETQSRSDMGPRSGDKRRRPYEDDNASRQVGGHHAHQSEARQASVNRTAISQVVTQYKHLLPAPRRLQLIRRLAYNDREAEMFNLLDPETQLEYIKEFAEGPTAEGSTFA